MIFFGLYVIWGFGYATVWQRLRIEAVGTIASRHDVPSLGAPRYTSEYVIVSDDGRASTYTAGATDASLARGLAPGTRISKRRWALGYSVGGRWMAFPVYFYGPILVGAVFAVIVGVVSI